MDLPPCPSVVARRRFRIPVLLSCLAVHSVTPSDAGTFYSITDVLAPDPPALSGFGASLLIRGDILLIGEPMRATSSSNLLSDLTHVFHRSGNGWQKEASWTFPNAAYSNSSRFGAALAMDGNTVAVGAPIASHVISEEVNANGDIVRRSGQGLVFVYTKTGGIWQDPVEINPGDRQIFNFGQSLALRGNTLAVGNPSSSGGGEIYFFSRSGTTWTPAGLLPNPTPAYGEGFGTAMAFIDDNTLSVGVPGENNNIGSVLIYARQGETWQLIETLSPTEGTTRADFGRSIAIDGSRMVIGAPEAFTTDYRTGAAYLFTRGPGGWSRTARLTASNSAYGDYFGASVSIQGDIIAVGAPNEDSIGGGLNNRNQTNNSLPNAGAVYLFTPDPGDGQWKESNFLKTPSGDLAGTAVVIDPPTGDVLIGGRRDVVRQSPGPEKEYVELEITLFHPDLDTPIAGPASFAFGEPWPVRFPFSMVSSTPDTFTLIFDQSGSFRKTGSVVLRIRDSLGVLPDFLGGTVVENTAIPDFDASRITSTPDSLMFHVQGLSYVAGISTVRMNLADSGTTSPPRIVSVADTGNTLTVRFEGPPGKTDWTVKGSPSLTGFTTGAATVVSLTEISPGIYQLVVSKPAGAPRHFIVIDG